MSPSASERVLEIVGFLGDHERPVVLLVDRHRNAVAIKDAATRRRQKADADAVLVGEHRIFIGLDDLQVIHAAEQGGEQHELPTAEEGGAAPDDFAMVVLALHRPSSSSIASLKHCGPHALLRTMSWTRVRAQLSTG